MDAVTPTDLFAVTSLDQLATLYDPPRELVLKKVTHRLEDRTRAFIAAAPFAILATVGPNGVHATPRGDAPGFIEPLESTSIHLVQSGIYRLLQHFPDRDFSPVNIAGYNRRLGREVELIRDFVILHYHATQRDDTPFWRHAAAMAIPDSLTERVEAFRDRGLLYQVGADEYFSMGSWLAVMLGQGIAPPAGNPLYMLQNPEGLAGNFSAFAQRLSGLAEQLPDHEAFLKAKNMWGADAA